MAKLTRQSAGSAVAEVISIYNQDRVVADVMKGVDFDAEMAKLLGDPS